VAADGGCPANGLSFALGVGVATVSDLGASATGAVSASFA
jgi:hypothetical protein